MVFILTPDKEYRQLPCPGVVTIGRGEHNTIVVAEKSVSTNHCKLTIEALPPTSKVQIWIEDLNSKNGTYAGDNRFEIERVTGKRIIHVGDLIRVGYCNNHLQIVDELPKGYQDINLPEIQIVPKNGSPGTSSAIRTMAPTAVIPPITQPASGNLNGSKSQGNFITSPNVPPRPNGLPYQSQDGFPSGLTPMQSVDPFLPAEPIPSQEINILPSQDPSPQPQLPALQLSQSQQPVQPASQLQPALDEAKQPANPLLLAVKLPSFHPFDRSNKGSLVKYLDLLDQWRDLLVAARGAMTKDQVYQEHYVKEVAGQRTKPKHKNNRFQNRYLQLASPRKTAGEDNEGGDSRDLAKEALLAELVAETMVGSNETSFSFLESALLNLHDMLHHCLLGAQIGSSTGTSDSKEMDYLVQNELVSVLQSSYKNVVALQNSPLLGAMHQYNLHRDNKCDIIAMTQQCVSVLERVMSFITKHEEIISIKFPISQYYEVLLAALSYVVEDLYDCYTVLLTLAMEADQAVITHTHAHKGHQKQRYSADIDLLSSYNAEVDEMRQVRYDADLLSLLERVREQESAVLSEKFKRIVRVVDIFTKWRLKVALYDWKFRTKDVKRQAIKQFDFSEKIKNKSRRRCWQMWREVFVRRRHLAKCLFRMSRAMSYNLEKVRRCYWEIWKRNSNLSPRWARASDSLAQLKLSVLQLQAQLQEQADKDANIAALAAEKALNKELTTTNNELRNNIQNLQLQLLELCNVSLAKRRDLVLHALLDKEEAVARSNKEVKFLKAELEGLRKLVGDIRPQRRVARGDGSEQEEEEGDDADERRGSGRFPKKSTGLYSETGRQTRPERKEVISRPAPARGAKIVRPGLMSRKEAVQIVIMEVRRLRESMLRLERQRDELKAVAVEETQKRIDQSTASQQLTYRLLDLERSAGGLRELLKQRIGMNGYTDLVLSLESMGVGAHVLQQSSLHAVPDPIAVAKLNKPVKRTKQSAREYENVVGDAFS